MGRNWTETLRDRKEGRVAGFDSADVPQEEQDYERERDVERVPAGAPVVAVEADELW